jgi:hypothetical protein
MTKAMLVSGGLLALAAGAIACNVHDNTINATANIPNASLTLTANADVDNVTPATSLPMTVDVKNVYLVEPSATVPPEHEADAGHLEFHIDDETTAAVLVTAQTMVMVPIPPATPPGHHKVICRVHKHDGEATETKFEVDITVKASVTISGSGGSTGAAGTSGAAGEGGAAGTSGAAGSSGAAGAGTDGGTTITTTVEVDASVTGSVMN